MVVPLARPGLKMGSEDEEGDSEAEDEAVVASEVEVAQVDREDLVSMGEYACSIRISVYLEFYVIFTFDKSLMNNTRN